MFFSMQVPEAGLPLLKKERPTCRSVSLAVSRRGTGGSGCRYWTLHAGRHMAAGIKQKQRANSGIVLFSAAPRENRIINKTPSIRAEWISSG
jgi:hypothetical protein